ncbi:diguanylate cyclase [Hydrogenovibrio sp. JE_KL2]|uniref:diguanylate cyclase n=1 Tax=Hydrogenovibrio sp. JE_KL2 TaxID=2651188 RepID=UPI00128BBD7D|nr:diguanylate cyclase [Hydrogenovibrio sp. JE_KL2]MPQ76534.1 GGDEF domain-containing protein [Hydrogenovibrio sp. JE_KL2]
MTTKPIKQRDENRLSWLARNLYNQWLILAAFLFSVTLVIIMAVSAQRLAERTIDNAAKMVSLQYEKLHNLLNLHLSGQNRTVNLGLVLMLQDAFEQDQAMNAFYQSGRNYTVHRDKLTELIQGDPNEVKWMDQINAMAKVTGPLQNRIANMALNEQRAQGIELLTHQVVPQLNVFSEKVNDFSRDQAKDTKQLITEAKHQVDDMVHVIILFTLLIIVTSVVLAFIIGRKFLRMNQRLKQANETLEKEVEARTRKLYETKEALLQKNRILEELSITDPLTQLYNRLKMESLLETFQQEFEQNNTPFSLLLIDLDFFKSINDSFGHNQGDQVLIELSVCLKLFFNENAHLGRWGGEEFIVVMENSDLTIAEQTADAFRKLVEDHEFSIAKPLTVSIGIASIKPNEPIAEFIHRADIALYSAKHNGRNQVRTESSAEQKD